MSDEKKAQVWRAIVNAVISILTALLASSCTLMCIGHVPFSGLMQ